MKDLMSYVPKKKQAGIKVIEKTMDGYEIVLNEGWLYANNNSQLICLTIAELRNDLKQVEFVGIEEFNAVLGITEVAEETSKAVETEVKPYWYELTNRGISVGTQPRQDFLTNHLTHVNSKGYDYGAVAYSRELTEKEIYDYELRAIEAPRELNRQEHEMLIIVSNIRKIKA